MLGSWDYSSGCKVAFFWSTFSGVVWNSFRARSLRKLRLNLYRRTPQKCLRVCMRDVDQAKVPKSTYKKCTWSWFFHAPKKSRLGDKAMKLASDDSSLSKEVIAGVLEKWLLFYPVATMVDNLLRYECKCVERPHENRLFRKLSCVNLTRTPFIYLIISLEAWESSIWHPPRSASGGVLRCGFTLIFLWLLT